MVQKSQTTTWDVWNPVNTGILIPHRLVSLPDFWTINSKSTAWPFMIVRPSALKDSGADFLAPEMALKTNLFLLNLRYVTSKIRTRNLRRVQWKISLNMSHKISRHTKISSPNLPASPFTYPTIPTKEPTNHHFAPRNIAWIWAIAIWTLALYPVLPW